MEIAGKVVLLTGASEGIGLATARLLTQQGAHVALPLNLRISLPNFPCTCIPNRYA